MSISEQIRIVLAKKNEIEEAARIKRQREEIEERKNMLDEVTQMRQFMEQSGVIGMMKEINSTFLGNKGKVKLNSGIFESGSLENISNSADDGTYWKTFEYPNSEAKLFWDDGIQKQIISLNYTNIKKLEHSDDPKSPEFREILETKLTQEYISKL